MSRKVSAELDSLMADLLGEERTLFFAQIGRQFPHTIRFNPLKGSSDELADFLREQGFEFEGLPGFENIFRIQYQPYPIGKSLSHFLGHIYVQDTSSMIPPLVLDVQPGERVLDLSAAPGSKTTQMAGMMLNSGVIIANDIVMKRLRALANNLQRMGVLNTAIFKWYGEQYGNQYYETFDKILLDPACSGLGTLHKSPEVLSWWTPDHCMRLAKSQKALLISAIKALRPGGRICYSTCTLTPEENEEVIDFALTNFPVVLESIDLPGLKSRPGLTEFRERRYHKHLSRALRLYPFENESEGFFLARIRKTESLGSAESTRRQRKPVSLPFVSYKTSPLKKYLEYLLQQFDFPKDIFKQFAFLFSKNIVALSREFQSFPLLSKPINLGLTVARPMTVGAKLTTEGCHLWGMQARRMSIQLPDLATVEKFVNRGVLDVTAPGKGQAVVRYKNLILGYGTIESGKLKSQFPRADWPFSLTDVRKHS